MFAACTFVPPTAAAVRRVAAPYKGIAKKGVGDPYDPLTRKRH